MPGFVLHGEEAELPRFSLPHGSQLTAENVPFVLQWGIDALAASKAPVPVLNGQEGLANVADPERMRTILSVNGLPPKAEAAEHKWLRQYVVFVFQLTPFAVYRTPDGPLLASRLRRGATRFVEVTATAASREVKRAQTFAWRVVYALGLDVARVRLGLRKNGGGRCWMSSRPHPCRISWCAAWNASWRCTRRIFNGIGSEPDRCSWEPTPNLCCATGGAS
jgi:hypothetical protein